MFRVVQTKGEFSLPLWKRKLYRKRCLNTCWMIIRNLWANKDTNEKNIKAKPTYMYIYAIFGR
jgi:hypothetical protein